MGIAAYNRGCAAVSRSIRADHHTDEESLKVRNMIEIIDRLNTLPRGTSRLYQPTVIRRGSKGDWWIMDHPEKGWGSYGYVYMTLAALLAEWNVWVTGCGQDGCSFFYRVTPNEVQS